MYDRYISGKVKNKSIAKKAILDMIADLSPIDEGGINKKYWTEALSSLSDDAVVAFLDKVRLGKAAITFFINVIPGFKWQDIDALAKKFDCEIMEKIQFNHIAVDGNGNPLPITKECMVVYLDISRLVQMVDKKNNVSTTAGMRVNPTTGHQENPVGRFTGPEMAGLEATGGYNITKENVKYRGDNPSANRSLEESIIKTGSASMAELDRLNPISSVGMGVSSSILNAAGLFLKINDQYMPDQNTINNNIKKKKEIIRTITKEKF